MANLFLIQAQQTMMQSISVMAFGLVSLGPHCFLHAVIFGWDDRCVCSQVLLGLLCTRSTPTVATITHPYYPSTLGLFTVPCLTNAQV